MTEWRSDAACLGADPELFFPDAGEMRKVREALAFCTDCPVRQQCLDDAVAAATTHEDYGIRGGMGQKARRRWRKKLESEKPALPPVIEPVKPKRPWNKHTGCSKPGCSRKHWARGFCSTHYSAFRNQQVEAGTWESLR